MQLEKTSRWETPFVGKVTLGFLLLVVAWGAYVRASGSGAGCGSHWPLCNGQVLPTSAQTKTWIEFTHRVTSGLSLILCLVLGWKSFQEYRPGSFSRKAGIASVFFIILEALLGAGLVLLELVAENKSFMRTASLGIHLLNTFLLLAAVALTERWSRQERSGPLKLRSWRGSFGLLFFSVLAVLGVFALGSSGAMTSLGDTLFPASSPVDGLREDFSPSSHFLIRLRIWHPVLAVFVSSFLGLFSWGLHRKFGKIGQSEASREVSYFAILLAGTLIAQLLLGSLNILLLVPISLQLGHLFLADLVWLFLVQLLASVWVSRSAAE